MAYDPNCEETKAAIAEAVSEATSGLVAKRDELLREVKTLRKNGGGDNTDKIEALEAKIDTLTEQLSTATSQAKILGKDLDKAKKRGDDEAAFSAKTLIDNALAAAASENKVADGLRGGFASMMREGVSVVVNNGERVVMKGDKPLVDYVKEWSGTPDAKHYIAAPSNGGGGAEGGGASGGGKTMTRSAYNALSIPEQAAFARDGGTIS